MDTPPPHLPIEQDAHALPDFFVILVKLLRLFTILCALLFTAAGAILAWNFFHFVKGIIEHPEEIALRWQTAMGPDHGLNLVETTTPAPEHELPQPAVAPPAAPESPAATEVPAPEAAATAESPAAPEAPPLESAPDSVVIPVVPHTPQQLPPSDADQFYAFASDLLDRFEAGKFSWLAAMVFLVIFCWILGKVPAVFLTTGTKVLLELLKVEPPRR